MSQLPGNERRDSDVSLFDLTYEQHHRSLYAFLLGKAGEAVAPDLLQETYLRVWRHVADLRLVPEERRRYWLFTLARNVLTDHYRRGSVRRRHESELDPDEQNEGSRAAVAAQTDQDSRMDINTAIGRLPQELRTLVAMRYLGEMDSSEIGEALGMPAGTVRYQLALARRQLARELRLGNSEATAGVAGDR
jgi:RNA polymerase sigma-70 factor, ECF subfamily